MRSNRDDARSRKAPPTIALTQKSLRSFFQITPPPTTAPRTNTYRPSPTQAIPPTRSYSTRQTHLQPTPLSATEDNFAYGDSIHQRAIKTFRLLGGNVNGFSASDNFQKVTASSLQVAQYEADCFCAIETNVDFTYRSAKHIIKRNMPPAWAKQINMASCNSKRTYDSYYQPGGMCQFVGGPTINRITASGSDISGLGQWTFQTITGRRNRHLTIITAYQACDGSSTSGEKTSWSQRQSILSESATTSSTQPNPKKHFIQALTQFCNTLIAANHGLVLMIDANSDVLAHNSWLPAFMADTNLADIYTYRHGCEQTFATHKMGTSRIDYMFATSEILQYTTACGYLEFDSMSDHRLMFLDLRLTDYLQEAPPPPSTNSQPRAIFSRHRKQSKEYKEKVLQQLHNNNYAQRLALLLERLQHQDFVLTDIDIQELETIDALITNSMVNLETDFLRLHDTPWSPILLAYVHTVAYWAAWISEIRTGRNLSPQRLRRIQQTNRINRPIDNATDITPTLQAATKQLQVCRKALREAIRNAQELREQWLLEQEDLADTAGDKQRAKMLRKIRRSEAARKIYTTVRMTLGGTVTGALSHIKYYDINGTLQTTFDPDEVTARIIARNVEHFHQADGTPFTHQAVEMICQQPLSQALSQLQQLTGKSDDAFASVVQGLSQPLGTPNLDLGLIDGPSLAGKFRRWKESTSTSPSHRHLGLYRAILKATNPELHRDDDTAHSDSLVGQEDHGAIFFHCLAQIINICVHSGYVLQRWKTIVSVMLEKIPQMPLIDKLRVIHLFEADLNAWAGIVFGRRMMREAEALGALGEEQGGSRKGRSATDVYAMKFFSFQMSELTRTSLAVMDNDAKACYDRIVMALATKRCEQIGVPHEACRLFENFLSTANYHISTQLGVSQESYTSNPEWKLHGPGQGNQSSPAIWAVVSTLLFHTMKTKFRGTTFSDPLQEIYLTHHMQAFVDDSSIWVNDFLQEIHGVPVDLSLIQELETATQWWEQLLTTSGGKLELTKCFYYYIQWAFDTEGSVSLASQTPDIQITIRQSTDDAHVTIPYKSSTEAHRTLCYQAQPQNDYKSQYAALKTKSQHLSRALYSHRLKPTEAQIAYHMVFLPRIRYTLPFCGLTNAQLNSIQSGPLSYTLQSMGYPKSFPRDVIFLAQEFGGVGFSSLFTEQGISNVTFILRHTRQQTEIGKFFLITLRWFQVHAGVSFLLLAEPHKPVPHIQNPWLIQLRAFLAASNSHLHLPGESLPSAQRDQDRNIMDIAILHIADTPSLRRINQVRLYLQVQHLSDISSIHGSHLSIPSKRKGGPQDLPSQSTSLWPLQPQPGPKSWKAWRSLMDTITTDGHKLRQPLGRWHSVDSTRTWHAIFDPVDHHVFIQEASLWKVYPHFVTETHGIITKNTHWDIISVPPPGIPLAPSRRRRHNFDKPFYRPTPGPKRKPHTWKTFCETLPTWEADLLRFTAEELESERLISFLQVENRSLYMVSDGGNIAHYGSYGWVIASENEILWKGWGTARGDPMSSYPAEAYGRLASICFLTRYLEYLDIQLPDTLEVLTYCDNDSLLKQERMWQQITIPNSFDHLRPVADAVTTILKCFNRLPRTVSSNHIKGHQDDTRHVSQLPWPAQLNVAADDLATYALTQSQAEYDQPMLPLSNNSYIVIQGHMITSNYAHMLRSAAGKAQGQQYLSRKLGIPITQLQHLHWDSYRLARSKLTGRQQAFVTKHLCNWLPTNSKRAKETSSVDPHCIHCPNCTENFDHVLRCPALTHWRHDFLHHLYDLLRDYHTPVHLVSVIHDSLTKWFSRELAMYDVQLLLKGCLPSTWVDQLDHHYLIHGHTSRQFTGTRWATVISKFIMMQVHQAWCIRSSMVDATEQTSHERQEQQRIHAEITRLYSLKPQSIIQYPFLIPLSQRLRHTVDQLKAWIINHRDNIIDSTKQWTNLQKRNPQTDIRTFLIPHRHKR